MCNTDSRACLSNFCLLLSSFLNFKISVSTYWEFPFHFCKMLYFAWCIWLYCMCRGYWKGITCTLVLYLYIYLYAKINPRCSNVLPRAIVPMNLNPDLKRLTLCSCDSLFILHFRVSFELKQPLRANCSGQLFCLRVANTVQLTFISSYTFSRWFLKT